MAIPKRIPIKRIADYRTEHIGTWSRGQLLGNILSQSHRLTLDGDSNFLMAAAPSRRSARTLRDDRLA